MRPTRPILIALGLAACAAASVHAAPPADARPRKTEVAIRGDAFRINGRPTYAGRRWRGHSIEGLLLNARMVQGIFDDLEPRTRSLWAYPDTGRWDPERNTREFLAAMPEWRRHGLLGFTINLQGGSPQGYTKGRQPWHNSALDERARCGPTSWPGSSASSTAPTSWAWSSSWGSSTSARTSAWRTKPP